MRIPRLRVCGASRTVELLFTAPHRIAFRSVAGGRIAVEHERPALEIEEGGFDTDESF